MNISVFIVVFLRGACINKVRRIHSHCEMIDDFGDAFPDKSIPKRRALDVATARPRRTTDNADDQEAEQIEGGVVNDDNLRADANGSRMSVL